VSKRLPYVRGHRVRRWQILFGGNGIEDQKTDRSQYRACAVAWYPPRLLNGHISPSFWQRSQDTVAVCVPHGFFNDSYSMRVPET
jgi:hypothetical protein